MTDVERMNRKGFRYEVGRGNGIQPMHDRVSQNKHVGFYFD